MAPPHRDPDLDHETPPAVVTAVSIGTAPLPFLAVYAILFILHGTISPAHPPDITSSQTGELLAGIAAAAIFVVLALAIWMFLGGRRRWPHVVGQLVVLGTVVWWLTDETTGGRAISILLVATTVVSLVFAFAPDGWTHVGRTPPPVVRRVFRATPFAAAATPAGSADPTPVEPAVMRRRRGA